MINQYKKFVLVGVILVLFVTLAGFSVKFIQLDNHQKKVASLEQTIMEIKAAMNIDSVRQHYIKKIMKIIDQFNTDLPSSTKYDIADEIYRLSLKYSNLDVDLICATISHESARTWNLSAEHCALLPVKGWDKHRTFNGWRGVSARLRGELDDTLGMGLGKPIVS